VNTLEQFRTKAELVDHIVRHHPELIYPERPQLNQFNRDSLDSLHRDLHNPPPSGLS